MKTWIKVILFFIIALSALAYLMATSCRTSKKEYENHGQFILNPPSFVIPDSVITTTGTLSLSLTKIDTTKILVDSLGNGRLATNY